jgi:DNA N-6-adenine-methyltransferase (Dam)
MKNRALFRSACHTWETPDDIYAVLNAEFLFDCDPCAPDSLWDGLAISWGNCNYVNPPYRRTAEWIKKGYEESLQGKTSVFLVPSRTDTRWFHNYVLPYASEIRFVKGRIKFKGAKNGAPFPSAIIIFRGKK